MPLYSVPLDVPRPVEELFPFFLRPANLLLLAPPDLHLELVQGPEVLTLGAQVAWKARRMGISQRLVNEVTALEANRLVVETQRQGPFPRWVQTHRFEPTPEGGTRLTEEIDFAPPGGLLGLVVTEAFLRKDLDALFAYRARKLRELFP